MYILKKAKDIGYIMILSALMALVFSGIFNGPVGTDFNTFFLYKDNYGISSNQITIIKIDSESLDELQKTDFRVLSLSKTVYVQLIEKLESLGARAIGFDIIFANRAADQDVLRMALEKYPNIVIGSWMKDKKSQYILPLDIYSGATWGTINMRLENNVVTSLHPQFTYSGRIIETLSIAVYRKFIGDKTIGKYSSGSYQITPVRHIPIDSENTVRIKFSYPPGGYPNYSLSDILHDRVPKEAISGKIILVGEYGTLIHDAHMSPVDSMHQMPGVEFHANLLDSIIQNKVLKKQNIMSFWLSIFIILIIQSILFYYPGTIISILIFCIYEILLLFIGRLLLVGGSEISIIRMLLPGQSDSIIDIFSYTIVGLSTFISASIYRYFITNKNRRYIEMAFSHYIAPDVVKQIAAHPHLFKLGGEKREMTFFFSDIAGFTTISEKMGPEKLFTFIEEYFTIMTNILIANKGTLDKYIGDAVMGFFNAPLQIEKSEYLACKTALEQQKILKQQNIVWKELDIPHIEVRIGIATGEAMVGNIGSKDRFNYTVIGDHVNLASRLEGVNKEYHTNICVSEKTYEKTKQDFIYRELDTIRVKGKEKGVKIFELVGFLNTPISLEVYQAYEKALGYYYSGEYKKAYDLFQNNTSDLTSIMMASRCQDILNGKVEIIDGIYTMKTK